MTHRPCWQAKPWLPVVGSTPCHMLVREVVRLAPLEVAGAAAEARLDERKWVDRAKGVLMRYQQLSAVEAFALLRTASKQANLRLGEVARDLIEAAQAVDAVNRAGQLRLHSQRFMKGLVLRGLPRSRPDDHFADTTRRLQANLDHLASLPQTDPVAAQMACTRAVWAALQACAGGDAAAAPRSADGAAWANRLVEAEWRAENLPNQADRLTAALESASGRRNLKVINLCGRQRMLSQRLAKQALLAGVLPDPAAAMQTAAAVATMRELEAALLALEQGAAGQPGHPSRIGPGAWPVAPPARRPAARREWRCRGRSCRAGPRERRLVQQI